MEGLMLQSAKEIRKGATTGLRSAVLELEEPILKVKAYAEAVTVFALYGVNNEDGLSANECRALLEIGYELLRAARSLDGAWDSIDKATGVDRVASLEMQP
jgi:hypothetical protein